MEDEREGARAAADDDHGVRYAAVRSRDRRFDGVFYTGVRTTGIYCRPSCPARTPAPGNVSFHPTAAAAQAAGFRACKRCRPDAVPDSPAWDLAAGTAGRAMRLIADGVVDREGVEGLARRLGYTPRHLGRLLTAELGAGPLALARAQRAHTARTLVETTDLPLADVAFAAGFSSVRQFNDTVREVYATTPTALRASRGGSRDGLPSGSRGGRRDAPSAPPVPGGTPLALTVAVRTPFAGRALLAFLAAHAVAGVEQVGSEAADGPGEGWYARTLDLPHGPGALRVRLVDLPADTPSGGVGAVPLVLHLTDLRDTGTALERARRLLDAACDPVAVAAHLGGDPLLADLVARHPGLRVPGQVDGAETAVRAVVGQQVSLAGARTVTGRVVAAHGARVDLPWPGLTHLFPRPEVLAACDPAGLPMPRARGRALVALAAAIAAGEVVLDRSAPRPAMRAAMTALPGIGPWTADYVAMRALGDPDVFLPGDLAVRRILAARGGPGDPRGALAVAEAWRPWRSYALCHLWQTVMPVPDEAPADPTPRSPGGR